MAGTQGNLPYASTGIFHCCWLPYTSASLRSLSAAPFSHCALLRQGDCFSLLRSIVITLAKKTTLPQPPPSKERGAGRCASRFSSAESAMLPPRGHIFSTHSFTCAPPRFCFAQFFLWPRQRGDILAIRCLPLASRSGSLHSGSAQNCTPALWYCADQNICPRRARSFNHFSHRRARLQWKLRLPAPPSRKTRSNGTFWGAPSRSARCVFFYWT